MGILHRIEGDIVELIVTGHFPVDELINGFRLMLEDEHLPSNSLVLINVMGSEEIPPVEVIERIASILSAGRKKLGPRMAIIVSQTVRYGRARQLGMMLEYAGILSQPFYDRKTAVAWLHGEEEA
jgi:hypothetical protein